MDFLFLVIIQYNIIYSLLRLIQFCLLGALSGSDETEIGSIELKI